MAADDGGLAKTNGWIQSRFSHYYAQVDLDLPLRFTKREWAFLFFDKSFMVRHLAFLKRDQLQVFLRDQAPRHVYYSTAYYSHPQAPTMAEKGWKGASLIFDLDSDHLRNTKGKSYEELLIEVKKEFIKLVDDFLVNKFGFSENEVHIVFSGGRGYHAHIESPKVLELNSYERREIVDRITGKNIDINHYLIEFAYSSFRRTDGKGFSKKTYMMPPPDTGDWRGDLTRAAISFFTGIRTLINEHKHPEAVKKIADLWGLSEVDAIYYLEILTKSDAAGFLKIDWMLRNGHVDFEEGMRKKFWTPFFNQIFIQSIGETDEPVTGDIKRLIRLPSSLHGKTGFMVKTIPFKELDKFDPLNDAICHSNKPISVLGLSDFEFNLKNISFKIQKGTHTELPEFAALFACLRGIAQLG